jgi:hypothetical protein
MALGFACWHAWSVSGYLDRVSAERFAVLSDVPAIPDDPVISLGIAADGRTWLRLTEERLAAGAWRFDRTEIDGPAEGREVFWHSSWSLWLEALGRIRTVHTGEALAVAMERASRWANLPLWGIAAILGAWCVGRRHGAVGAAVFAGALLGHRGFYIACYPAYPDHHALAAVLALGLVLGLSLGNFGALASGERGRREFLFSALCGAVGLAISAASLVPVIAMTAVAGFAVRGLANRFVGTAGLTCGAKLWRAWGRVGGGVALLLYVLEFVPGRLAWRLEVNHPVHALAWWGAAELIAWWWRRGAGAAVPEARGWAWVGGLAVLAPIPVLGFGGAVVFSTLDPFVREVHRHIDEFQPVWRAGGTVPFLFGLTMLPLALVPWAWLRGDPGARTVLAALAGVALGLTLLAAAQHRWWALAGAAQIPLAALAVASGSGEARSGRRSWRAVVAVLLLAALPSPWLLAREQIRVARLRDVQPGEAMQLLFRDLAGVVRREAGGKEPVLLAPPDASLGLSYYGRMRAVGTLYWENHTGLRAAARVLASTDDAEAAWELSRLGVTHLLLVDPGDFTAEYAAALTRAGAGPVALADTLGRRLLAGREVPSWCRAIPYPVPPQFERLGVRVALYAFAPGQRRMEAWQALGVSRLVAGDEEAGRSALREAARAGSAPAALLLAWRLASGENVSPVEAAEALRLARQALEAMPEDANGFRVLAAAQAAAGRWPEAQAAALRALDLAQEAGRPELAVEIEREFLRYRDAPLAAPARPR